MDPLATVGAGLTVLGSKDLLTRLLGPTADYVGSEIKGFVEKCNLNLDRIFQKAERKLGKNLDVPGVVNPRVLKHVIDEGRFCDDELVAEYIAGVLASSRTDSEEDDRGVNLVTLLKRLSKYQIKSHYIFYHSFKQLFDNKTYQWNTVHPASITITCKSYFETMQLDDYDKTKCESILQHCLFGLLHEGLIRACPPKIFVERDFFFHPSVRGIELYSWAHGFQDVPVSDFLKTPFGPAISTIQFPSDASITHASISTWNLS